MMCLRLMGAALLLASLAPTPPAAAELAGAAQGTRSLAEVRDRLRIQIRAESDPRAEGAVWRQDLLGTRTVLMLAGETPDGDRDVTVQEAAIWGRAPDELMAIGLANLERRQPPEFRTSPPIEPGLRIHIFYREDAYAAAHVLWAARDKRCLGTRGAIVSIPNRHSVLCYPIESSLAPRGYLAMVNLTLDILVVGENPVAPHVFWFHDGVFEAQPVRIADGRILYERTEAFKALLRDPPRDILGPHERRW